MEQMPRFKHRPLALFDLLEPFEPTSSNVHARNAISALQRLDDLGREHLGDKSASYKRWRRCYSELFDFINKEMRKKELSTTLRDFVNRFEHCRDRFHQLLYSSSIAGKRDRLIAEVWDWSNLFYQFATYAILAAHVGGKTEETTVYIRLNLRTRKSSQHWVHRPIKVPRRYRREEAVAALLQCG